MDVCCVLDHDFVFNGTWKGPLKEYLPWLAVAQLTSSLAPHRSCSIKRCYLRCTSNSPCS